MSLTDQFGTEISLPPKVVTCLKGALVEADVGKPVKIGASNTAALCADTNEIVGILAAANEPDVVSVKLAGIVEMAYTGSNPALGRNKLVANGAGGCKVLAESTFDQLLVVDVDTTAKIVKFILNNA